MTLVGDAIGRTCCAKNWREGEKKRVLRVTRARADVDKHFERIRKEYVPNGLGMMLVLSLQGGGRADRDSAGSRMIWAETEFASPRRRQRQQALACVGLLPVTCHAVAC